MARRKHRPAIRIHLTRKQRLQLRNDQKIQRFKAEDFKPIELLDLDSDDWSNFKFDYDDEVLEPFKSDIRKVR